MNVRIVPRGHPQRTDLYGGVQRVVSDGTVLHLRMSIGEAWLPLVDVAEILLDDEPGDWW